MSEPEHTDLTERQRYWLKHIRACEAAGQTAVEYARARGIKVKTLYSPRKTLADGSAMASVYGSSAWSGIGLPGPGTSLHG